MRHSTQVLILLVLFITIATAVAVEVPTPAPAVLEQQTAVQFKKLQHLLEESIAIGTTYQEATRHLLNTYGDVEVGNLYHGIDLTTSSGIRTARQRLNAFSAKHDGFADAKERYWADEQEQVRSSTLAEPLASQFRESLSVDQTETIPKNRAWFTAMLAYVTAVGHLLEVADSHLGHLQWQNKHLTTTDDRATTELAAAQRAVSDAERHCNETGWAAFDRHDHVNEFLRSSMLELEKELRRRNGP